MALLSLLPCVIKIMPDVNFEEKTHSGASSRR